MSYSHRVYVTSIKNVSPNAQSFFFSCCQFSLKATRFGLLHNALMPRQQLAALSPSNMGTSNLMGVCTCCTAVVLVAVTIDGLFAVCCTRWDSANYLRKLYLRQLHHLGPLFCLWYLMSYLWIHLSLATLKGHHPYYWCLPTVSTFEQTFQAAPAVTT